MNQRSKGDEAAKQVTRVGGAMVGTACIPIGRQIDGFYNYRNSRYLILDYCVSCHKQQGPVVHLSPIMRISKWHPRRHKSCNRLEHGDACVHPPIIIDPTARPPSTVHPGPVKRFRWCFSLPSSLTDYLWWRWPRRSFPLGCGERFCLKYVPMGTWIPTKVGPIASGGVKGLRFIHYQINWNSVVTAYRTP